MSDQQKKEKKAKRKAFALKTVDKVGNFIRGVGPYLLCVVGGVILAVRTGNKGKSNKT